MPSKAEDYRERAERADRLAEAAKDPQVRETYRDIARQWRLLAEQSDRSRW
jgi:hypothetical protein